MMRIRLIQRLNPLNSLLPKKWFAVTVNDGRITEKDLGTEISERSSLSRGDVMNVIINVLEAIPKYLLMGKSVSLGELGSIRLSVSSEGVENPEEFTVGMIKGLKVVFTPGKGLKDKLLNAKFERES
jgi:predicted histone-like DNA-binding protein